MNDHSTDKIPIIKLWRILLVPLQGGITDRASEFLKAEVLTRIHGEDVDGLIIDISALWLVDSHLCSILSHIASAAALMGTQTVISGMKPETAITLETMGIELRGVHTTLNLEEALHELGVRRADDADERLNEDVTEFGKLAGSLGDLEDWS
jgi:rsbT antagonist protein RsbS